MTQSSLIALFLHIIYASSQNILITYLQNNVEYYCNQYYLLLLSRNSWLKVFIPPRRKKHHSIVMALPPVSAAGPVWAVAPPFVSPCTATCPLARRAVGRAAAGTPSSPGGHRQKQTNGTFTSAGFLIKWDLIYTIKHDVVSHSDTCK